MKNNNPEIPKGRYCYFGCRGTDSYKPCPYWSCNNIKRFEPNGYCSLIGLSDKEIEEKGCTGLLWDQVKECDINND